MPEEDNDMEGQRRNSLKPNKTKVKCVAPMIMLDRFTV
jgi:hypothetical protein